MSIQPTEDIDNLLENVFKDDLPCEVKSHATSPRVHSGAGEWYVTQKCKGCGISITTLICNTYRNYVLSHVDVKLKCTECSTITTLGECILSMVHRGDN